MRKLVYIDEVISAIQFAEEGVWGWKGEITKAIEALSPIHKKGYTKADYIMALHKEYGCSLARAEEAHQKALEYLRNTSIMKG